MKRISKSLALLIAVLMMFSCFTFSASAADSGEYYFTDAEGVAGDEVTVSLVNKTEIHLIASVVAFTYDETALELVGYSVSSEHIDAGNTPKTLAEIKKVKKFSYSNDTSPTDIVLPAGAVLGTLTFRILDGTVAGDYKVTPAIPANDPTYDFDFNDLTMTCTAGTITVKEAVKYTVTFTDGATFTDKASGDKITVPAYAGAVPSGKVFNGWKNTSSEEVLTVGAEYTVAGNATFAASWRDAEIETDDTTVPDEVVITVVKKPDAPSADKITAIEEQLGNLLTVKAAALSFEITAEKNSAAITELERDVTFKIYFNTIANYSEAKTYRLFHFDAAGNFKEECALTKNSDHFAFTVNSLSPFVLAEVGVADAVVEYIPVATYDKTAGTVAVNLSVSGAKLGMGSFGFKYDTTKLTSPTISYKSNVAKSASAFITDGAVSTADAVRDTWIGWNGATVASVDASSAAVEFATITFDTTEAFDESDFRANPTTYFYVDTPTDTLNNAVYYDGTWRADIWEDNLTVPTGAYPTVARDLTVTAPTTVTVRGSFKKEGTSIITVAGDPGYSSLAVVKLYAKGSTTAYKTATTNEAVGSGNTVVFEFTDVELGEYYFTIEKNGYLKYTSTVVSVTDETDISGTAVVLIPGDIKGSMSDTAGDGVVDVYDFIRIIRGLDSMAGDMLKGAVDISEDGFITIDDLGFVKTNYKMTTDAYGN